MYTINKNEQPYTKFRKELEGRTESFLRYLHVAVSLGPRPVEGWGPKWVGT